MVTLVTWPWTRMEAEAARVSLVVTTLPGYVPAAGFVMPAIVRVALELLATAHVAPASRIDTTPPLDVAVAVQFVKPDVSPIVGTAGMLKAGSNVTVIVSPAA